MSHVTSKIAGSLWRATRHWLLARVAEFQQCRDCGGKVSPWDDCCTHCGSGRPARVAISAAGVFLLGCAAIFVLYLALA